MSYIHFKDASYFVVAFPLLQGIMTFLGSFLFVQTGCIIYTKLYICTFFPMKSQTVGFFPVFEY